MQIKKVVTAFIFFTVCSILAPAYGNCRQHDDDSAAQRCTAMGIEAMKRDNPDKFRDFQHTLRHIRKVNRKQDARVSCYVAKALVDHVHWEKYRFSSDEHRLNFLSVLMGIIRVESAFDPEAVSPKNARGLMQVHWPTWKRCFASPGEAHDLHKNLLVGTGILRLCMRQSDNDLRRALYKYLGAKDDRYADMVISGALAFKKSVLLNPLKINIGEEPK